MFRAILERGSFPSLRLAVESRRWWSDSSKHLVKRRPVLEKKIAAVFSDAPKSDSVLSFDGEIRSVAGKHVAKLREQKLTPALVFGKGQPEIFIQIEEKKLQAALRKSDIVCGDTLLCVDSGRLERM